MKIDTDAHYLDSHEWVRLENDLAVIGLSDFAQDSLSDIVYVELPEIGDELEKGDSLGVVESVKAASDVYMPIGGSVVAVNRALEDSPELINQDPFGEGWLIKIKPGDLDELDALMGAEEYKAFLAEQEEE